MAGWFGFIRVTSEKEQEAVAGLLEMMPEYSGLFHLAGTATMDIADPHPPANALLPESEKGFKKGDLVALVNIMNLNDPFTIFLDAGVRGDSIPYHQELSNFNAEARSDTGDLLLKGLEPFPTIEAWYEALTSERLKKAFRELPQFVGMKQSEGELT